MQMTLSHDQINPSIRSEAAARLDVVTLRLIHRRDEILELKPRHCANISHSSVQLEQSEAVASNEERCERVEGQRRSSGFRSCIGAW